MSNHIADNKHSALVAKNTTALRHNVDLEHSWLATMTGAEGTRGELWALFLDGQGVAPGQLNDRKSAWFASRGYSGSLSDQLLAFWKAGAPTE